MRPPRGDIGVSCLLYRCLPHPNKYDLWQDDRVRAISLAMGMVPILWTSTADGGKFDSNGLFKLGLSP